MIEFTLEISNWNFGNQLTITAGKVYFFFTLLTIENKLCIFYLDNKTYLCFTRAGVTSGSNFLFKRNESLIFTSDSGNE